MYPLKGCHSKPYENSYPRCLFSAYIDDDLLCKSSSGVAVGIITVSGAPDENAVTIFEPSEAKSR
jgi:hypothetical protein